MKILFLDVDGVMNNVVSHKGKRGPASFDPECLNQLKRVFEETGCKVVLSSTWRISYTPEKFNRECLAPFDLPEVVIGRTRQAVSCGRMDEHLREERGVQIMDYLKDVPSPDSWAVVDDDSDMAGVPPERFVKTEWEVGLTKEHADRLIDILNRV